MMRGRFLLFPRCAANGQTGRISHRGHWLNGRLEIAPLPELIASVLADHEAGSAEIDPLGEAIEGYVIDRPMTRARLWSR